MISVDHTNNALRNHSWKIWYTSQLDNPIGVIEKVNTQARASMNIMRTSAKGTIIVLVIFVMVRISVELKWMTENLSVTSCEGKEERLMWNYSLGENEIVQEQQWLYNNTTLIAYQSESRGFVAPPSYKDRVQSFGKSGISLKNVTVLDTGEYTLYPKLHKEESTNWQTIFLTVYAETETSMCRPDTTIHFEKVLYCVTNSCGGQQSSTINFKKHDLVVNGTDLIVNGSYFIVNGSYLISNSSWQFKQVFCCSSERNIKCHSGDHYCGSVLILSSDESIPIKEELSPASSYGYGVQTLILIDVLLTLVIGIGMVVAAIVWCCREKHICHQTKRFPTVNIRKTGAEIYPLIKDHIAPSAGEMGRSSSMGNSQETLRTEANGPATEESVGLVVVQDVPSQMALEKINSVLEQFLGFKDADLAQCIWEMGKKQDNPNRFALALDSTELVEFMFPDNIVLKFWEAIKDARVAVSRV